MVGGLTISDEALRAYPMRARTVRPLVHSFGVVDGIDRLWAATILFMNGWIFALPIADELPLWFTPVQVAHGVFVHEALLIAYVIFILVTRIRRVARVPHRAWQFALMISGLGILALISALVNVRPLREFLGAARYFLLTAYFLLAVYWTRRHGLTFVLRYLLLGIFSAGVVNLLYTFTIQSNMLGGFPLLLGEQGPGGYLGISVILSAWLMLERQTKSDTLIAVAAAVTGVFAVSISFSKLAMLMAAAGVIAWLFVLWRDLHVPGRRKWYAVIVVALVAVVWTNQEFAVRYLRGAKNFIDFKFKYLDVASFAARSQYFLITAEIVAQHPLFGVSYGGYYDAAIQTRASRSDLAAIESPEAGARGQSNPHSSFLYYASANGIPGILLTIMMLGSGLFLLAQSMLRRGIPGLALWASFAFAYLLFGLTLPTLFNSSAFYLPVAVAACMRRPRLRYRRKVHPIHSQ